MTDTVVVINSPVNGLAKLFYNTQTYLDQKTEELRQLSQDEAAARLDNLQEADFYTFSDLELLFGKADLTRPGAERYKYKNYLAASRLLAYLANSKDQLSAAQISAIFNRFELSDSELIQIFKSFPQIVQQLPPQTLLGYANLSKKLARYILSTQELKQVLDQNKYARTLIYQSHPASLWLCEHVFGIEADVEDVQKMNDYLRHDLRVDLPNLDAISAVVARRKTLELERDELEKRLISLNLFLDAVKAHANAKSAERKAAAQQWLDSLQLKFPTVAAQVRAINNEIKSTIAAQKTKQDAINATLPELRSLCKNAQLGKYTLDIFLRRQASAEEVEQSRQNLLDLIKIRPNYMTLIDVRHIAAMIAMVHHENEGSKENAIISIFSYLCSNAHTLTQLTEYLTHVSGCIARDEVLVNEIESNAFDVIRRFIYQEGVLFAQEKPDGQQFLSKYPALGKAIFELHPDHLKNIDKISDSSSRLNFLHTNRSNFKCEHLLNINLTLRDPKERKTFFYNGAKDQNKETPLDKLHKGIDKLIRNELAGHENSESIALPREGSIINRIMLEKDHKLLLDAMCDDDLRGWINLARDRVQDDRNYIELWLKAAPHGDTYNEDVAKTIALDSNLLNALKKSPNFETIRANNKYIYIADFIEQKISSYNRWTVSGQKDDFIQSIIRSVDRPESSPLDDEIFKDCLCWYIANNEDLWQRMLKAKVYNSGWWWWKESDEVINTNLQELISASDHFRPKAMSILATLRSSSSSPANSPRNREVSGGEAQSNLRASRASDGESHSSAPQSDAGSAPSSTQVSAKNSPRIDGQPANSSPRGLSVPADPLPPQRLSPRHADAAAQPIGFEVRMNVVDFAAKLQEPRTDDELRKMATHNKEHVRQRYDLEWTAARRATTVKVKEELLKHWCLYEAFLTERAKQGRIQQDELRVLLQIERPDCRVWVVNFHRAHDDSIELIYKLFSDVSNDAVPLNQQDIHFYLPLLQVRELQNDELEKFYKLDNPVVDQVLGSSSKPNVKAFLKTKFGLENRANVSRRIKLFEQFSIDTKLDNTTRLKFFSADGSTSQMVKSAFEKLFSQEPDKALSFLRAADQAVINQNIRMFLSVLEISPETRAESLKVDDCQKLYNTGWHEVLLPLFAIKSYFEFVMRPAKSEYPFEQLDIMLQLIAEGKCSHIIDERQLRTFLAGRVIQLCANFETNKSLLIKLFEIPAAQALFESGGVHVITALAKVESIDVAFGLINTFSQSAAFSEFLKGNEIGAILESNDCFSTAALTDNHLRDKLFVEGKTEAQFKQQLLALYRRNNRDLTTRLFALHVHNMPQFNLEKLTGEELRDLYFAQNSRFAECASDVIFKNCKLRSTLLSALDEAQAAEFISQYLLKDENDHIENFLQDCNDMLPLLKGAPLIKLLSQNISFARLVLMNGKYRRSLNLTHTHFYYVINRLKAADLLKFLADKPDRSYISLAFKEAIKKGHADKVEIFLCDPLRSLIDNHIVCDGGEVSMQSLQQFPWAKTAEGTDLMNLVMTKFFNVPAPEKPDLQKIQKLLEGSEETLAGLHKRLQNAVEHEQQEEVINAIKNDIKSRHVLILSYLYELSVAISSDDTKAEEYSRKVTEYVDSFKKIFGDTPIEAVAHYCLNLPHYVPQVFKLILQQLIPQLGQDAMLNDIRNEDLRTMLHDPLLCSFLTPGKIRSIANTPEMALYCITHQHVLEEVLKNQVYILIDVAKAAGLGNDNVTAVQNLLALKPIRDTDSFRFLKSNLERQISSNRASSAGAAAAIASVRDREGFLGGSPSSNPLMPPPAGRASQTGSPRSDLGASSTSSSPRVDKQG